MEYVVNEDFIVRDIEDKLVIVNINDAKYYTLNEIGNLILHHIIQENEYDDPLKDVQSKFEVDQTQFEVDFKTFVRELTSKSILSPAGKA